jgi:hypothetical protein
VSGFSFFTTFFGVFLIDRFQFTQGDIGDFFSYMGLWIVFTQAVIVRRVSKKFGEPAVLRVSLIASGVCLLFYHVPTVWWGLLFIVPFFAMFNGLTQANLIGLLSRSASPRIQGEILGINASVQALAQVAPPLIAGLVASASAEAPLYTRRRSSSSASSSLIHPVSEPRVGRVTPTTRPERASCIPDRDRGVDSPTWVTPGRCRARAGGGSRPPRTDPPTRRGRRSNRRTAIVQPNRASTWPTRRADGERTRRRAEASGRYGHRAAPTSIAMRPHRGRPWIARLKSRSSGAAGSTRGHGHRASA